MSDARLRRATDALAYLVAETNEPLDIHFGTVTAVTGSLVTYTDALDATIADVLCVGTLPASGDRVVVLQRTPLRVVMGPIASD